ncbi:MAG TPA: dual specificity protein phosphatase family protein, partial [Oscillatoriaceae cyanobacterium]
MSETESSVPDESQSLKQRLKATRDRLIHGAATRMIDLGRQNPRLRRAGYWLYGTATRYLPRGREVGKFGSVGDNVYRGAQPSLRALRALQEIGVQTVINLRPECDYERRIVERLGMRYVYLPLPPLDAPSHDTTLDFLQHVMNPENGVVFFHCYHGVDRTGTMAACLRMARDDWSVDEALAEMRDYKVHESGQRAKVDYLT